MSEKCKCGGTEFFTEKKGSATGLYCSKCGKWQKWLRKDEIRLFERDLLKNKSDNTEKLMHQRAEEYNRLHPMTNADRIRAMSDEELAEFLTAILGPCRMEFLDEIKGSCIMECKHCDCDEMFCNIKSWLQSKAKESEE